MQTIRTCTVRLMYIFVFFNCEGTDASMFTSVMHLHYNYTVSYSRSQHFGVETKKLICQTKSVLAHAATGSPACRVPN